MNAEKFTQKSLDAVRTAKSMAEENRNNYITPEHLLYALVDQDGGLIPSLLGKMKVDCNAVLSELDTAIAALPKVGNVSEVYLSPECDRAINAAEKAAKSMGDEYISVEHLNQVIAGLHEFNPMMGHRGCRLDVTYPEIAKMQTAAIIKAALAVRSRRPAWKITPEIMVPLVGEEKELAFVKSVIDKTAKKIIKEAGSDMTYKVGTMIEIPRAALTADAIANEAEFFSFGTNDLTQMTFGFSRDDAGKFLASYYDRKIYESDPFSKLDQAGVGRLVKMAAELGRQTRPDIKLGICGEQGGDPSTVEFCHKIGLTYVSCSPFRVPIARLAAAQAAIKDKK